MLTNRLQWNGILTIGNPLVKCISLWGLKIFLSVSGCEGVHSTCPFCTIGTNGISFIPLVFHWLNACHYGDLEYLRQLHAATVCILLVHWCNWCDWYQWNDIPLVLHWWNAYHYGDLGYLCVQIRLGVGSFYSSIGTIGTNRYHSFPLVFHWWIAYHYGDLKNFSGRFWLRGGLFSLVHWYDWYE